MTEIVKKSSCIAPILLKNTFLFSHSVHVAMCGPGKQQGSTRKSQTSPSSLSSTTTKSTFSTTSPKSGAPSYQRNIHF